MMISLRSPECRRSTMQPFRDQRGRYARQTIAQLRRRLRPILGTMRGFGGVVVDLFEQRAKPSGFARSTLRIATATASASKEASDKSR
jgi:hypothetical protein